MRNFVQMDDRFVAAMERAIAQGLELRRPAGGQKKAPEETGAKFGAKEKRPEKDRGIRASGFAASAADAQ